MATQETLKDGIERHQHRLHGLLLTLVGMVEDTAQQDPSWSLQVELADLERTLAYRIANAREGALFNLDEQAAVEKVLASVDPHGQAHFGIKRGTPPRYRRRA